MKMKADYCLISLNFYSQYKKKSCVEPENRLKFSATKKSIDDVVSIRNIKYSQVFYLGSCLVEFLLIT